MRTTLVVIGFACALHADSLVEGPRLGHVASGAGVRSVLGITGASRLSDPMTKDLRNALVLPGHDAAVGLDPEGNLVRVDLRDGSTQPFGLNAIKDVAVSPLGQGILATSEDRLYLFAASGSSTGNFALPGTPRLTAVSDRAATAALTITESDGEALYVITELGERRVFHASRIAALAFLPNSGDLVVADDAGTIFRLNSDLQLTQVAALPDTKAIAVTGDGLRLLAVAGRTIHTVRFDTGEATSVECACTGSVARPLGDSKFLLTTVDDGPIWMVDASADQLRVAFIPEPVNE